MSAGGSVAQAVLVAAAPAMPPRPSLLLVVVTAFAGLALVAALWAVTSHAVTIAHEGGHALAASATGGTIEWIMVDRRGNGATMMLHGGWSGLLLTALAGYLGPSLFGLAGAILLNQGLAPAVLWISLGFLACALAMARNLYTAGLVAATAAVFVGLIWLGSAGLQLTCGYTWIWFLLFGGVRGVTELGRARRGGRDESSDAYQLARLTFIPAALWVGLFWLAAAAALIAGSLILVAATGPTELPS